MIIFAIGFTITVVLGEVLNISSDRITLIVIALGFNSIISLLENKKVGKQ